jgi:hypothetical protein
MPEANIFSALGKYSTSEENYLTEAFVVLLNTLLARERAVAVEILNKLCVANNEFCFDVTEDISVSTQEATEQGRPDIKISSPDKLVYVEVKYEAELGEKQLERYNEALNSSSAVIKCVVLLTKFPVDFGEKDRKPDKHVRWREVHNWLASLKPREAVSEYLVNSFKSFLEVKRMTIQKVGWEYINGVSALNNLIDMVEEGAKRASISIYRRCPAWESKGLYLENAEFWCGVSFYDPDHLQVIFQLCDKNKFNKNLSHLVVREGKDSFFFDLMLEDIHFFSLDKDKQFDEITKFVKNAYTEAQQMRVK